MEVKKIQIENEIKSVENAINQGTKESEEIPNKISEYESKLPKLIDGLRVLRSQIFIYETRLRAAYQAGNAAN